MVLYVPLGDIVFVHIGFIRGLQGLHGKSVLQPHS